MNNHFFLPLGGATGVGSVPMIDPDEAVAFVADCCPRIPFWPQLPQRAPSESMIEQALLPFGDLVRRTEQRTGYEVLPGAEEEFVRRLDDAPAELQPDAAAGFYAFERALAAGAFPHAAALKGQIVGPITLATQLRVQGRSLFDAPGASAIANIEIFRAVGWYVTRLALWQIERLQRWGRPVILVLDEPCLSLAVSRRSPVGHHVLPVLKESLTMMRAAGAIAGLHCCARLPTALAYRARPDLISFDAHQGLEDFFADPHMQAFMRAGGLVAFGIVPTLSDLSEFHPLTLLSRWLEAAMSVGDIADLAERSLFTATCGLGLLGERAARQSFQLVGQLSASVAGLLRRASRSVSNLLSVGPSAARPPHPYTAFPLWQRRGGWSFRKGDTPSSSL
ncbi:MAG: hypothetical protein RMN25_03595 [Anaerolineae bacterium]|nr:hypothetical protein [Thermoflexales bacterium]MDW8406844.1 hypothetical protein [Anaerolineae bacterium]